LENKTKFNTKNFFNNFSKGKSYWLLSEIIENINIFTPLNFTEFDIVNYVFELLDNLNSDFPLKKSYEVVFISDNIDFNKYIDQKYDNSFLILMSLNEKDYRINNLRFDLKFSKDLTILIVNSLIEGINILSLKKHSFKLNNLNYNNFFSKDLIKDADIILNYKNLKTSNIKTILYDINKQIKDIKDIDSFYKLIENYNVYFDIFNNFIYDTPKTVLTIDSIIEDLRHNENIEINIEIVNLGKMIDIFNNKMFHYNFRKHEYLEHKDINKDFYINNFNNLKGNLKLLPDKELDNIADYDKNNLIQRQIIKDHSIEYKIKEKLNNKIPILVNDLNKFNGFDKDLSLLEKDNLQIYKYNSFLSKDSEKNIKNKPLIDNDVGLIFVSIERLDFTLNIPKLNRIYFD